MPPDLIERVILCSPSDTARSTRIAASEPLGDRRQRTDGHQSVAAEFFMRRCGFAPSPTLYHQSTERPNWVCPDLCVQGELGADQAPC